MVPRFLLYPALFKRALSLVDPFYLDEKPSFLQVASLRVRSMYPFFEPSASWLSLPRFPPLDVPPFARSCLLLFTFHILDLFLNGYRSDLPAVFDIPQAFSLILFFLFSPVLQ